MDSRHQKILQYLNRYGANVEMDITPALRELYPGVDRMDHKRVMQESREILRLLSDMQRNDLIRYKKPAIGTGNKQTGLSWIDITPVYASLTEKGKIMLGEPLPQRVTTLPTPSSSPFQPQPQSQPHPQPQSQPQSQPHPHPQYQPHKPRTNTSNNSAGKTILTAISFAFLIGSAIEMCNDDAEREKFAPVRINSSPQDEKRIRAEFDKIKSSIRRNRLDSGRKN